jgi:hypothetical protein
MPHGKQALTTPTLMVDILASIDAIRYATKTETTAEDEGEHTKKH